MKTIVITGCSKGVGKKLRDILLEKGDTVVACSRTPVSDNSKIQYKYGNRYKPIHFDFSDSASVEAGAKKIRQLKLPIHGIVNVAAAIETATFIETQISKLIRLFEINFFNQILFTQILIKNLIKNKDGSVVFISSASSRMGVAGRLGYSASKAAIESAVRTLAKELGKFSIRVNAISPGLIDTAMLHDNTPKELLPILSDSLCIKRLGKADEVADTAIYLLSDKSSYITGQILQIDGGLF